jgi:ketosteroid isomerase-like protein
VTFSTSAWSSTWSTGPAETTRAASRRWLGPGRSRSPPGRTAEPTDFIESGAHVVVPTHVTARGKGSGVAVTADTATVWTFEAGKVVRLALHWDAAAALAAVGLSPS